MSALAWTATCALSVAALLAAEYRGARVGIALAKPLAACCYIGLALQQGALASTYGLCVLVALCLSWWGDVLLIPRDAPRSFQAGLFCFLTGHLAYVAAFAVRGVSIAALSVAAPVVFLAAYAVLRWLREKIPRDMRSPVLAYVNVIAAMLIVAVGTVAEAWSTFVLLGAAMFCLSDLAVARERFVAAGFWNGAWGLPCYFGAQLLLAASIGE